MNSNAVRLILMAFGLLVSGVSSADVTVVDPYVRAVPPGAPATAAFMGLQADKGNVALVKASSDVARSVELHTHIHDNGVMRMRPVDKIELKKGETVTLQPGGLHVMLIGLTRPVKPGDSVEIELSFSDGTKQQISAPVRKIEMKMPMQHGGHMPAKH